MRRCHAWQVGAAGKEEGLRTFGRLGAAPCTAPFMASAIGFALTQSNLVALTIFAALGLGMAAPYVLLCYSPTLLRALPRPGAWMARFKELLAFPMYASAIWLVWVLTQQAGSMGVLLILGGLLLLVFAIWLLRDLGGSLLRRRVLMVTALMLVALALSLPIQLEGPATGVESQDMASGPSQSYAGPAYGTYSDANLASLRATGPVFVNLTAAWCITCKVNEAVALNHEAVRLAFEAKGVEYLKGDWTNQDAEISRLLEAHGRSGEFGASYSEVLRSLIVGILIPQHGNNNFELGTRAARRTTYTIQLRTHNTDFTHKCTRFLGDSDLSQWQSTTHCHYYTCTYI